MTAIEIAIIVFISTGILGFLGKKMVEMLQIKLRKHKSDHEFVEYSLAQAEKQNDEHQQLMISVALLIESNISQNANSLLRQHKEYISKGSITVNEFKTFERLHKIYVAMGGNGTIEKLFADIKELPTDVN